LETDKKRAIKENKTSSTTNQTGRLRNVGISAAVGNLKV